MKRALGFMNKSQPIVYNTLIGGVSATISTPALLASKLAIDVSRISNFEVVGSDIKCFITGSYGIPASAFRFNTTPSTYYIDSDYLVTSIGDYAFYAGGSFNGYDADFQNCLNVGLSVFSANNSNIFLKNATTLGNAAFYGGTNIKVIYIPNVTTIGTDVGMQDGAYQRVFLMESTNFSNLKIYAHPSMATINGGGVEGDLANAISRGATVRYVTNFTIPLTPTSTSFGTIYSTAIQLIDAGGSTNAIDSFEVTVNGVFYGNVKTNEYITGLQPSTSHNITLIAVDIFYNKSAVSNTLTQSTATPSYIDSDANAYISAASLTGVEQESAYALIVELKSNSLYTKCQAIYPFKGTTASQHKFNAKNPVDTDGAFRLTFTGAATFSNNGYQLNGSSYANTYFVPSVQQALNSNGITVVCGTNNAAFSSNVVEVGAYNSATQASYLMVKNNNTNYKRRTALNSETVECSQSGTNEAKGIFTGTKQSSTVTDLFVNGSQVATSNQSAGTLPTLNIYIGALNFANSGVTHSNQRIQIVILHEGLSDAEVATLHSIIDLSETIAGRKTW